MNAKLTRIHLGLGMAQIGVQFEIADGAGGTVTQRAFVAVSDAALAPVWLEAQAALDASLAALPLDLPPGNVTTALMRQRTAEAAEEAARAAKLEAEQAAAKAEKQRQAADTERERLDAEAAANRAMVVELNEQIAATVAEATKVRVRLDVDAAAKSAELADLDEQLSKKRAELEALAAQPTEGGVDGP